MNNKRHKGSPQVSLSDWRSNESERKMIYIWNRKCVGDPLDVLNVNESEDQPSLTCCASVGGGGGGGVVGGGRVE